MTPQEPLFDRRFRAIFEQSEVPTQLYSAEGRIIACNGAWYRWTRLTTKDVETLNTSGYCLLEDPALIRTGVVGNFRKALDGTAVQTPPVFYNLADYGLHEQTMWIQANFYPIPDAEGKIAEVLILHHDVSELMQAKREAEAALEQAKSIAQQAPVAIQIYNAEGYSIYTNPQHTRIFGGPPPPGYCTLNDSLVAAAGNLHLIRAAFSGQPGKLPLFWYNPSCLDLEKSDSEYVKKQGKNCAIETHMVPILDADRKVTNVVYIFKDVTGELFMQQEREVALKERDDAKTLIQTVLDQTRAVIYIKDLDDRFTFINGQFLRIFDKPADQILGKTGHELFPKSFADEFRKNDLHVLTTRSHSEIEEEAIHADGAKHTYLSLKFPIEDSAGKLYGICGISTDITQYRGLEKELSTAKRMEAVGLLAGGVAHNFNNILGVILLVADTILIRGAAKKSELKTSIEAIKSAAQSAAFLTRQLLTFGQKQVSAPRNIDLGYVVQGTKGILGNALGEDIQFSTEIEPKLWPVSVDPNQIEQILTNLCFNSKDAMPRGGKLKVGLRNIVLKEQSNWRIGRPSGEFVELTIADTGVGIESQYLDRVFEPFFTTKKDGRGTGLGLATVYGAVQAAQGDIAVESVPGAGTTFRVCFPRAAGPVAKHEVPKRVGSKAYRGKETILLIEDQLTLRSVTANLLEEYGYTVLEAGDGKAALTLWKKNQKKIGLVMTDIIMPGGSGLDVVRKMTKVKPVRPIKVLFVSAYSEKKLADYSFDQGSFHFIEKPYSADELLSKLREVLLS